MRKLTLVIIAVLLGLSAKAQKTESKYDVRLGLGTSLLGTGDMQTIMFENEANAKLNKYFTLSGGIGYAKSDYGVYEQASFVQLNSNVYISPFKNNRKNDFRIGTGLSAYSIFDAYQSAATYKNGELINTEYEFDKRNSIGLNLIIENTYSVTDKFLMGLKLFSQLYQNGDINSGIMLKFGIKI